MERNWWRELAGTTKPTFKGSGTQMCWHVGQQNPGAGANHETENEGKKG